ncbi:MAG: hypothetical protein P1U87_07345 [Verrucomicrobiales bacterium]|nr:hypothetical protein [Verrucomicrobiales bacterium]
MKTKIPHLALLSSLMGLLISVHPADAQTSQGSRGPGAIYKVADSATFSITSPSSLFSSDKFLWSWTDTGISPSAVYEPDLILKAGVPYTFNPSRVSGETANLVLMSGNMPVAGSSDNLRRTFQDQPTLDSFILPNGVNLTGNDLNTSQIVWTPAVGVYYYTTRTLSNTQIVGRINVVDDVAAFPLPKPRLTVDDKRIESKRRRVLIAGTTSAKTVRVSYKGKRRVSKLAKTRADGDWKFKVQPDKSRRTTKVKVIGIGFDSQRSRIQRVTIRKPKKFSIDLDFDF